MILNDSQVIWMLGLLGISMVVNVFLLLIIIKKQKRGK